MITTLTIEGQQREVEWEGEGGGGGRETDFGGRNKGNSQIRLIRKRLTLRSTLSAKRKWPLNRTVLKYRSNFSFPGKKSVTSHSRQASGE